MRGWMYVDKNRGKRALGVAATNDFDRLDTNVKSVLPFPGFYILSNCLFLVDMGAFVSVFSVYDAHHTNRQLGGFQLVSANGSAIQLYLRQPRHLPKLLWA